MRTDGRTVGDMTKLIVAFRNFTKKPKTLKMTKNCTIPRYIMALEILCTIKEKL